MIHPSAAAALPAPRATRRAFDRAADFDACAFVHDEARLRLFERLAWARIAPGVALDLGTATARSALELARLYPDARVLALDSSLGMLRAAAVRSASTPRVARVAGDAHGLPIATASVDLIVANLVLPWCLPQAVFAEAARVLVPGGLLAFSTFGPDTLSELRRAWAAVDDRIHVHAFFDMHDLGDLALAAGLAEPVLDVDRVEVTYGDVGSLVRDLRGSGSVNVAAGRRSTLTGASRWRGFVQRLAGSGPGERFGITVELVFGQAWGRAPRAARGTQVEVRISDIGGRHRPRV